MRMNDEGKLPFSIIKKENIAGSEVVQLLSAVIKSLVVSCI